MSGHLNVTGIKGEKMKKLLALVLAVSAGMSLSLYSLDKSIADNEKVEKVEAITSIANTKGKKIFVVGDSTFSSFNDSYYYPRYGIGTKIQDYLLENKVQVVNLAMSGRSSKSFLTEPNYKTLVQNIKKGDYLVIGFGHNDEKTEEARYTNPNGTKEDSGSFKNVRYDNYIKLALSKKATPVLCTPIVRRAPGKAYEGAYVHITKSTSEFPGGDYPQAIRDLGKECGVIVVDNTEYTKKLYESLGDNETVKFHAWLGHKSGSVDNTHLNMYGASLMAFHVVNEIASNDKNFAKLVKKDITEPKEDYLVPNPSYKIPVYSPFEKSDKSTVFETTEPWYGTVFGDMGGVEKIAAPEIYEIVEDNGKVMMHSGGKTGSPNAGKIASGSDGIAFYFQQIPSNKDFTLSATVEVLNIVKNNQVSFGLMVRDDVYIDKYDNQVKSDYVAAGVLGLAKGDDAYSTSFQRADGSLKQTTVASQPFPAKGSKIPLSITKTGNTYSVKFGSDTATYTADLTSVDSKWVYAGLYTVRAAYVEYSDIVLEIK